MEYTVKVQENGNVKYYKPGTDILHREDGPAIENTDGHKAWYKEGKCHREDGPAVIFSTGCKAWYKEGNYHREDGPAIEYTDGSKSWYIDGKKLSEEKFENRTKEAKVHTFTVPANTTQIRIQLE
jgi:hypothetical protein